MSEGARMRRGSCEQSGRDQELAGQVYVEWISFALALGAFPNRCWRGAFWWPGMPGPASLPGFLPLQSHEGLLRSD